MVVEAGTIKKNILAYTWIGKILENITQTLANVISLVGLDGMDELG